MTYTNHYTYSILHIPTHLEYLGVRSTNLEPVNDIGFKYFSSSTNKEFKVDQRKNPDNYRYLVLRNFDTREEASKHEIYLHSINDVSINPKFINRSKASSTGFDNSGNKHTLKAKQAVSLANLGKVSWNRGLTHKEDNRIASGDAWGNANRREEQSIRATLTNLARSKEQSEMMRKHNPMFDLDVVQKFKDSWTIERRRKQSIDNSGNCNPNYGNKMNQKSKDNISSANTGSNNGMAKPVLIDGEEFGYMGDAAKAGKGSTTTIRKRLKDPLNTNYTYL